MVKIKCPHCGSEAGLEHRIYMKGEFYLHI